MRKFTAPIIGFLTILVLSLQLVTCGGGGDGTPTAAAPAAGSEAPKGQYTVQEVVDKIYATLGEDRGFSGVALGMDKGYSIGQIAQGAMTSRLFPSGDIIDAAGATVAPKYPASDLIEARSTDIADWTKARKTALDFLKIKADEKAKNLGGAGIVALILMLGDNGYSGSQIIEAILLDRELKKFFVRIEVSTEGESRGVYQIFIYDEKGKKIEPGRKQDQGTLTPGGLPAETPPEEEEEPADPMPWTFGGSRTSEFNATANYGVGGTARCAGSAPLTINLHEDGSVSGNTNKIRFVAEWDGDGNAVACNASPTEGGSISGEHSSGSFEFTTPVVVGITFQGTYSQYSIGGGGGKSGTFSLSIGGAASYYINTSFSISRSK